MGAEDIRRHVDESLARIKKELVDIANGMPEGALQERVSKLSSEIEKLVYETLAEVPKTTDEQNLGIGFDFIDHRSNQASYGGVPEMFMTTDQTTHRINYSYGGMGELFDSEDVEMNVRRGDEDDGEIEADLKNSPSPSPSYEGVGRLFIDGPLKGKMNYNGVTEMFEKSNETLVSNDGELKKDTGKEFDTTGRNHDRRFSIGGIGQLADELEDEEFFADQNNKIGSDDGEPQAALSVPEGHNRAESYGGVRQLVEVECDTFSDLELEASPQASNEAQNKVLSGHERNVIDGGRQPSSTVLSEEDLNFDGTNVLLEDQSHNLEANDPLESPTREDDLGQHGRQVSHGGVRLIQEYDLGLDDIGDNMLAGKPRELFDGQRTVEDPGGHERRRSNLQDGRELFEEMEKGDPFNQRRGDFEIGNSSQQSVKIQDLRREHLQLKMSKIELIKSTAEEIDRLRGIVKFLANQLRQKTDEHNKLLNATIGGQMLDSVSGVFGAVTGFFSAPSQPSSEHMDRY